MNAIEIKNLTKSYGDRLILDGISLDIKQGEIFGLLGRNGVGKSTFIECVLGTKEASFDHLSILGMNPLTARKELFENVGVQFQGSNYQERIKVNELCQLYSSFYKETVNYEELLIDFGLNQFVNNFVNDLSGGERQRLSIVLALISNPKLVFLDELTTGLDPQSRREVWIYLKRLKEKGLTIFLTSHYMDEVERLCDRIAIMKDKEIVALGSVKEVIDSCDSNIQTMEDAYLWYINGGVLDEII